MISAVNDVLDRVFGLVFKVLRAVENGETPTLRNEDDRKPIRVSYDLKIATLESRASSPGSTEEGSPGRAEPQVEVTEKGRKVTLLALLPGVREEDLRISDNGSSIRIDASGRDGHLTWNVPFRTRTRVVSTKFKNGVLEIVLRRGKGRKAGL